MKSKTKTFYRVLYLHVFETKDKLILRWPFTKKMAVLNLSYVRLCAIDRMQYRHNTEYKRFTRNIL